MEKEKNRFTYDSNVGISEITEKEYIDSILEKTDNKSEKESKNEQE